MQKSKESETLTSERDQTDFESFRITQEDFNHSVKHGRTGMAQLVQSSLVEKEDLPSEYINNRNLKNKSYLVFEAILGETEKTVKVICPADDSVQRKTILEWTNSDCIEELAGKKVPIRNVGDNIYEVESFISIPSSVLDIVPIDIIKEMIDTELLKFENGRWQSSGLLTISLIFLISSPIFASILLLVHLPSIAGIPLFLIISLTHVMITTVMSRSTS
jgi:hypothetical protein